MDEFDKKYYRISQVSEILGIPMSTLRFWESQFSIIKPKRTDKGTRLYSSSDIEKIKMVNYLVRERGIKIDVAQEMIRHNHAGVSKRYETIERLKAIRLELIGLLSSLSSKNR